MATGGRAAAGSGSAAIWKVTFEKDGPPAGTGGAAAAFSFGARTSLGVHGIVGPQEIQLGKAGSSLEKKKQQVSQRNPPAIAAGRQQATALLLLLGWCTPGTKARGR